MALSKTALKRVIDSVPEPDGDDVGKWVVGVCRAIEAEVRKQDEAQKVLNAVHDQHQLSDEEQSMLEDLRDRGFAVCVFNPDEIRDADPGSVEERMCAAGWDAIGGPWE